MPKYDGVGLAAGAFSNAISDMFKGMAEGAERQPLLANQWQTFDQNQAKFPLEQQQRQATLQSTQTANQLSAEELSNRPTLRQREATAEQRAQESHGWQGQEHQWRGQEAGQKNAAFGWQAAAQARAEAARQALAAWYAKRGGNLNLSDPQQLQELNGILAQHGGELGQHPLVAEGLKNAGPPASYEAGMMRILSKPQEQWTTQERNMVQQWNRERSALAGANESLAKFRDARAGYFDSRKGLGGMDTKDLQRNWMALQADAFKNARLVMQDVMGSTDMSKLGSNPQEILAGLNWLKSIYIKQQLATQPLLSEWLESQMGGYKEEPMPQHIALKAAAAKEPWFWKRWLQGINSGVNAANPHPALQQQQPQLPPGWSIQQVPE